MRVGYARASIDGPTAESQIDSLRNAHCKRIFVDQIDGQTLKRPELAHCLRILDEGDTLIVCRLDKLGRSLRDLVYIMAGLEERGIQFLSLTEGINTKRATGKLILHFFATLAEFERNIVRERTMVGLTTARNEGRLGGRKKITTRSDDKQMIALRKSKRYSIPELAKEFGISESTLSRRLRAHSVKNRGPQSSE